MNNNESAGFDASESARKKAFAELEIELKNKGYSAGLIEKGNSWWRLKNNFGDVIALFVFGNRLQAVNSLKEYSIRYGVPLIFVGVQNNRVKYFKYIKFKFVEDGSWHEIDFMLVFPKYNSATEAEIAMKTINKVVVEYNSIKMQSSIVCGVLFLMWLIWLIVHLTKCGFICGSKGELPYFLGSLVFIVLIYFLPLFQVIRIGKDSITLIQQKIQSEENKKGE